LKLQPDVQPNRGQVTELGKIKTKESFIGREEAREGTYKQQDFICEIILQIVAKIWKTERCSQK